MTLSTRIATVFSLAGALLFGAYAIYLLHEEADELRVAIEREVQILGRNLQSAIAFAIRDGQMEDVRAMLNRMQATDPDIRVLVLDVEAMPLLSPAAMEDPVVFDMARQALRENASQWQYHPASDPLNIVFSAPLQDDSGAQIGSVVMLRPLDDMRDDLQRTRRGLILTVSLFVAVAISLGLILGHLLRKPLAQLKRAMQQLSAGEFPDQLTLQRKDEIGDLARAFDDLAQRLERSRRKLAAEQMSRRALETAMQKADKLITIGQLSAGLAHEIGSPLQVVSGRARLLLDAPETDTRRQAQIIVDEADRITGIVTQLLDYTRRKPLRIERVDAAMLASRVVDLLELEARRHRVALTLQTDPALPLAEADPDQLQQVMLNLINNALAATQADGRVIVAIQAEGHLLRIRVSDTGKGIAESVQPHLFEPFFTTRSASGGTGLGLAVVKSIVDAHSGHIHFQSTPGQGSDFVVELPLSQQTSMESGA